MKLIILLLFVIVFFLPAVASYSLEKPSVINKHNRLRQSADGGRTWLVINGDNSTANRPSTIPVNLPAVSKSEASINAFINKNGKRFTLDGGRTWKKVIDEIKPLPDSNEGLTVYPNPVVGNIIYVAVPMDVSGKGLVIRVCDVFGKYLINTVLSKDRVNPGVLSIEIGALSNGYYLLKVSTDFDELVTGFVISR